MNIDAAALSLLGDRKENQDRVATLGNGEALLLVVVDGMGGHSHGANAAQATEEVLRGLFKGLICYYLSFFDLVAFSNSSGLLMLKKDLSSGSKPRISSLLKYRTRTFGKNLKI